MMTDETKRIIRFDRIWSAMLAEGGPFTVESGLKCSACGNVNRSVMVSNAGRIVCADCHGLPAHEGWFGIKTNHPQGDQLLRMPMSPKFVKRFPSP